MAMLAVVTSKYRLQQALVQGSRPAGTVQPFVQPVVHGLPHRPGEALGL